MSPRPPQHAGHPHKNYPQKVTDVEAVVARRLQEGLSTFPCGPEK
jgi:hypothetical protein